MRVESYLFGRDGHVPNHQHFPMLHYAACFDVDGDRLTSRSIIAGLRTNGWGGAWVNGIYPFQHYHGAAHEVLVNLGDDVNVQFGGASGPVLVFRRGDVVILPAGTGHCRMSSPAHLEIVGAYPLGQEDWDLRRDTPADYAAAVAAIPTVPVPAQDPVTGEADPLRSHWLERR